MTENEKIVQKIASVMESDVIAPHIRGMIDRICDMATPANDDEWEQLAILALSLADSAWTNAIDHAISEVLGKTWTNPEDWPRVIGLSQEAPNLVQSETHSQSSTNTRKGDTMTSAAKRSIAIAAYDALQGVLIEQCNQGKTHGISDMLEWAEEMILVILHECDANPGTVNVMNVADKAAAYYDQREETIAETLSKARHTASLTPTQNERVWKIVLRVEMPSEKYHDVWDVRGLAEEILHNLCQQDFHVTEVESVTPEMD